MKKTSSKKLEYNVYFPPKTTPRMKKLIDDIANECHALCITSDGFIIEGNSVSSAKAVDMWFADIRSKLPSKLLTEWAEKVNKTIIDYRKPNMKYYDNSKVTYDKV